ncbi:hypothetical protein [Rufibacter tibetensis]|uniref:Uncharacterized protein n=1 Tax=Rufibacter tibetensis TaxID=512763 RepID=A0A0P0D0X7_9BACT|nr:hypothetical protein [Rufibacter tibetensis]ALJ00707.1 hypothetical protein DC20_19145 [Rufibacter tibetensis]
MRKWSPILVLASLLSCNPNQGKVHQLEKNIASKEATIDSLRDVIAGAEVGVTETEGQESLSPFPVNAKLYGKVSSSEIKGLEFAEVLAIAEADTSFSSDDYEVRVYLACNGPADPELEECNCSHYAYVTTGTYDMPIDYRLFRVGPFFMPKFGRWGGTKQQPELTIEHQVKGKPEKTIVRVLDSENIALSNKG